MKKLLQINSVANTGSTGRISEGIGLEVMKHNWESYIAFGRHANNSSSTLIKIGSQYDQNLHALSTRIFDNHGLCSKKATNCFLKRVDEIRPDIIHLHNIHGYYINYKLLFNYLASNDIPVIWTLHDCWPFTGHCAYYDLIGCNKWMVECHNCPQKQFYPSSFFLDRSTKNYTDKKKAFTSIKNLTIVPVSNWLNENISKSFISNYPSTVIHNGIDIDAFKYTVREYSFLENKFVILGVANVWDRRKGLNDFIELSKKLHSDEIIVLVGLGKGLQANLPNNIIAIERTESVHELAQLYSRANVFVNPTWEDNFPTTNIEALACGTYVITYDTGGSPEAVTEETGSVIKKGNITGLIEIIAKVKENDKSKYLNICRERAVKYFDYRDRYKEYIDLYNSLIEKI